LKAIVRLMLAWPILFLIDCLLWLLGYSWTNERKATVAACRNHRRVPAGGISVTAGETAHCHKANDEHDGRL